MSDRLWDWMYGVLIVSAIVLLTQFVIFVSVVMWKEVSGACA